MAITWGPSRNSCRVGLEWEPLPAIAAGTTAVTVGLKVWFQANVRMYDSTNSASWSGDLGSGSGSNDNLTGAGTTLLRTIRKSIPLVYGSRNVITENYRQYNIEYTGDLTASASITLPARPYAVPAAPTGLTVQRYTDNKNTLRWTNNSTSTAPYERIYVQRYTDEGEYVTVATLGGTTTAWSDTGTRSDHAYSWRVAGWNSGGYSPWTAFGFVYTTPLSPIIGKAVKINATTISISWTKNARHAQTYEIWESQNGGVSFSLLANVSGANTTTRHVNPSTSVTHTYRVRIKNTNMAPSEVNVYSGYSSNTNTVQLAAPPLAPLGLTPNGSGVDAYEPIILEWKHNPADSSEQTAFELLNRYSSDDGITWSSGPSLKISTSLESYETYEMWPAGSKVEWQIRTWGVHPNPSPWSAVATFQASTRPSVTILSPRDNGIVDNSTLRVVWSTYDDENDPQSSAVVTLYDGSGANELQFWNVVGGVASLTVPGQLADATDYVVGVQATAGGLQSDEARVALRVAYVRPPVPKVALYYDQSSASVRIDIDSTSSSATGLPLAVANEVYSNGVLLGTIVAGGGISTFIDPVPDLRGLPYTVRAVSALPSYSETQPLFVEIPPSDVGVHFNTGRDYEKHVALWAGAPTFSDSVESDIVIERYDGDPLPSVTFGPGREWSTGLTGTAFFNQPDSSQEDWEALARSTDTVCLRRRDGMYYGVITDLSVSKTNNLYGEISLKFTETRREARD